MPFNFTDTTYLLCQDVFSVPCTFHPLYSQPDAPSFQARGIYDSDMLDVVTEDGGVFTDQRTILDIRTAEFAVLPAQKDQVDIPHDCNGEPLGLFEIVDATNNGGGEMTLTLRRFTEPKNDLQPMPEQTAAGISRRNGR